MQINSISEKKIPHLYNLESTKCCFLSNCMSINGFLWHWNHEPSTSFELQELLQLYTDISDLDTSIVTSGYGFRCSLTKTGEYKVNCMKRRIDSIITSFKGHGVCWSKMVPLKVKCFIWRASLDCILVVVSLSKRGVRNINLACSFCNKAHETADHRMLRCDSSNQYINGFLTGVKFRLKDSLISQSSLAWRTWVVIEKKKRSLILSYFALCGTYG